jgi:hypothetical protein
MLGEIINTIKKNRKALLNASREVGLKVNADKIKYMLMSQHQNARQSHNSLTANKSFGKCRKVKIFGNNSNKSKLNSLKN